MQQYVWKEYCITKPAERQASDEAIIEVRAKAIPSFSSKWWPRRRMVFVKTTIDRASLFSSIQYWKGALTQIPLIKQPDCNEELSNLQVRKCKPYPTTQNLLEYQFQSMNWRYRSILSSVWNTPVTEKMLSTFRHIYYFAQCCSSQKWGLGVENLCQQSLNLSSRQQVKHLKNWKN